jgi:hypothetical protein
MLKIIESVKTEIEATTGQTIPDPQSAGFEPFFETLARDHPDLAKKLEDALEVTEPYPEEEAKRDAKRRESIAATLQRVFFREMWGRQVLNRRGLTLMIFFVMFGVMATSWTMMLLRKPNQSLAQTQPTQQASITATESRQNSFTDTQRNIPTETSALADNMSSDNLLTVPETTQTAAPSEDVPPRTLDITTMPAPSQTNLPLYTGQVPTEANETKVPDELSRESVLAFETPDASFVELPVFAFEEEQNLEPVTAFDEQGAEQSSILAFEPREPTEPAPVLTESFLNSEVRLETTALSPIDELETDNTESPVLAFELIGEDEATRDNPEQLEATDDLPPNDLTIPETVNESSPASLLETSTLEPETLPTDLLQVGTLIPATLTKDVVLTAGETRQVIADSDKKWCGEDCPPLRWLGEATLLESGRLEVVFKQVIVKDKVIQINGTAYGDDNAEGLPAHLADTTPTLLADLLRSGAGGVSDYVQAQTNKRTVTKQGDTTVTEQNVPALLDFILGRAASAVQIPEGETNIIRLAAVPKGTRLEVLYLERK